MTAPEIDPRFVCRREGHVPQINFETIKTTVPCEIMCYCWRCGEAITVRIGPTQEAS